MRGSQRDPQRLGLPRRKFGNALSRRFSAVSKAIVSLIVDEDALGLARNDPLSEMLANNRWYFLTDPQKLAAFRVWLRERVEAEILGLPPGIDPSRPWLAEYIESTYRTALVRSYIEIHGLETAASPFYEGGQAAFLRDAFAGPVGTRQIELLYTRAFTQLQGVTDHMGAQLSRILADGFVDGSSQAAVARKMTQEIAGISRNRARLLAHTELSRAYVEGQLDGFEALGQDELILLAEWTTTGGSRVCPKCVDMNGALMTIEEARGLLPRHPGCRCAWRAITRRNGGLTRTERRALTGKLRRSVRSERSGAPSLRAAIEQSVWAGADLL